MIELGNIRHGQLIAKSTRSIFSPDAETVISRSENGELYGGVIYDSYAGSSLCIHVAGFKPHWMNRNLLWLAFTYPFLQLKVDMLIGRVGENNLPALKFDTHIGFKEVARIPKASWGKDLVILVMKKEDCKWLNLKPRGLKVLDHLKMRKYGVAA